MANKLTVDNQGNKKIENVERCFWDGGIASNTPLRELIQAHKDYWQDVKGKDDAKIPDLDVYIVDVWPTKQNNIPVDHDGVVDRNFELLLSDKTAYDEKVADIVSDYINLVYEFMTLQMKHTIGNAKMKNRLHTIKNTKPKASHRSGDPREYQDIIKGRFEINVIRIERTSNIDNDISNKLFDYSADTIKHYLVMDLKMQ